MVHLGVLAISLSSENKLIGLSSFLNKLIYRLATAILQIVSAATNYFGIIFFAHLQHYNLQTN